MTERAPPLIGYAPPGMELSADRLLRRIVAWLAILIGGHALVLKALHVGLARGWLASPPNMSWSIDERWQVVQMVFSSLVMLAMLFGGVLLLRRSPVAILLLRASAACLILQSVVSQVMYLLTNSILRSYWSTPGSAAVNALQFFQSLWLTLLV